MDVYKACATRNGVIQSAQNVEGSMKPYQKVIAVGSSVRNVKVGDVVMINPRNYMVRKYDKNSIHNDIDDNPVISYNFNILNVGGQDCLLIQENDIDFIIDDYELEEFDLDEDEKKKASDLYTGKVATVTDKPKIVI